MTLYEYMDSKIPDYYDTMYRDGYSPEQILHAARRKILQEHEARKAAKSKKNRDIVNEIGEKEGELIRKYRPILNTQIPKKENWHKWDTNAIDARAALKLLLDE